MPKQEVDLRCDYCGNVGGEYVKNHDTMDDCVACNDCIQLYLQTYKENKKKLSDIMAGVKDDFLNKVKTRFKLCPLCNGEGHIQPSEEHKRIQKLTSGTDTVSVAKTVVLEEAEVEPDVVTTKSPKESVNTVQSMNRSN